MVPKTPDRALSATRRLRRASRRAGLAVSRRTANVWSTYERDLQQSRARFDPPQPEHRASLTELAGQFKTDKWGQHRYAQHYQRHLEHLRDEPINLLEIGVGGYISPDKGGESLRMWKAFFPRAQIFGLDIHEKSALEEDRIRIFRADQSAPASLRLVAEQIGRLDVVIDDGSHLSPHVRVSFQTLFPLLSVDGIYAIEDLQTSYWPEFMGSEDCHDPATSMALVKDLVDGLNYEEYVDPQYAPTYTDLHVTEVHAYHNLVLVQKGANSEGTRRRSILGERYAKPSSARPKDAEPGEG